MSLKIVVLAKQVPDTRNVGKDAMTPEGTVNRAALPAIFNPDDLNALEQALRLKEQIPGTSVGVLTMGPPRAGEIIRQGLFRGADTGWLLTDRLFAGADTLATSYALSAAIKKIGGVDLVLGGRQAIDGDTAQVGPQVAQKLGLNQVTYAEEILGIKDGVVTVRRRIDGGQETVQVYVKRLDDAGAPIKSLKGFKKISLAPGETQKVKITLGPGSFEYYDESIDELSVLPGRYQILYGSSSRDKDLKSIDFQVI